MDSAKAIVGAMRQFGIEPRRPENAELCEFIFNYEIIPDVNFNSEVGSAIASLWRDECMEDLLERQSEFYLMDSAP